MSALKLIGGTILSGQVMETMRLQWKNAYHRDNQPDDVPIVLHPTIDQLVIQL